MKWYYVFIGMIFILFSCKKPVSQNSNKSDSEQDTTVVQPDSIVPKVIENKPAIVRAPSNIIFGDSIVNFGKKYLGTPYVKAGHTEAGFDCSGFVYFVFQHFKTRVPRSSKDYEHFGVEIPIDSVQKGDVLLFLSPTRNKIGHVGIVSKANGKESDFIHATSGKKKQVVITSLKNKRYTRRFVKAVRVVE